MARFRRLSFAIAFLIAAVVTPARFSAAEPTTISFAFAGDHGANVKTTASLEKLDKSGVDFYLAIGDLDYKQSLGPTPAEWCAYVKSHLPTLGSDFPFQVLAGNHEEKTILQHAACLPDRMNSTLGPSNEYATEYYFDYPSSAPLVRVLMISPGLTINNVSYNYTAGSTRYRWVADAIDNARAAGIPWTVVGMHKNWTEVGTDLMNLLVAKKVDLVLQGHDHTYRRSKQLAFGPSCATVAGSFNQSCVARDGADGRYVKGRGAVVLINGSFGWEGSSSASGYWVKTANNNGFTKFTMTADRVDAQFVKSSGTFTETYSIEPNAAPSITRPANRDEVEEQTVRVQVSALDAEGDAITYGATGLPPGLSIHPTSGVISGTIALGSAQGSPYTVVVTASDGIEVASAQFTWMVRDITAPATPAGLTMTAQTTGVLLEWNRNTDSDLAGYNVYRSGSASGPFTKLNADLLTVPSYMDEAAPVAATSHYHLTALDWVGNESPVRVGSVRRSKIRFISSSSAAGNGMTMAIPKPPGVAPGDVLLAALNVRGSDAVMPPPGWTLVSQVTRASALNHQAIFRRTVQSADPTSYTFRVIGRASAVGMILAYRGAREQPVRTGGQANPASTSITAPSITSPAADAVLVGVFGITTDTTIGPPARMMERLEIRRLSGPLRAALVMTDTVVPAQALGTKVAIAAKPGHNIGQVVVLAPAP